MNKESQLKQLGLKRRQTQWPNYANIGDFHDGAYDCEWVSPWTKSASNIDAKFMLIAQDWAGADYLSAPLRADVARLGYDPYLETNINLQRLLKTYLNVAFEECFATNLFPFIKQGSMNKAIPACDYRLAARDYLFPQIQILQPKVLICLGLPAYRFTSELFGVKPEARIGDAIAHPLQIGKMQVFAVTHTGRLGTNNRGRDQVERDWEYLANRIK
ncbi:MAG: hypothetical protein QM645_09595 [Asticcacaulis sp.]